MTVEQYNKDLKELQSIIPLDKQYLLSILLDYQYFDGMVNGLSNTLKVLNVDVKKINQSVTDFKEYKEKL